MAVQWVRPRNKRAQGCPRWLHNRGARNKNETPQEAKSHLVPAVEAVLMVSGTQIQAENARLRGQLSKAIADAHYWRELAIFLEAERDHYRDQVRGD